LDAVALERDVMSERLKARRALDDEGRGTDAIQPVGEREPGDARARDDDFQRHAPPNDATPRQRISKSRILPVPFERSSSSMGPPKDGAGEGWWRRRARGGPGARGRWARRRGAGDRRTPDRLPR